MTWTLIVTFYVYASLAAPMTSVSTGYASHKSCDQAGDAAHQEYLRRDSAFKHHKDTFEWKCVKVDDK